MTDFENTLNQLLSNPEQMEKLMGVAKAFVLSSDDAAGESRSEGVREAAGERRTDAISALAGLDPKLIGVIGKLMGEYNSGSDKEALLHAISPYLKAERRSQFERATEMAKLARLARVAMSEFGGLG